MLPGGAEPSASETPSVTPSSEETGSVNALLGEDKLTKVPKGHNLRVSSDQLLLLTVSAIFGQHSALTVFSIGRTTVNTSYNRQGAVTCKSSLLPLTFPITFRKALCASESSCQECTMKMLAEFEGLSV